jgi:hypothetical protein
MDARLVGIINSRLPNAVAPENPLNRGGATVLGVMLSTVIPVIAICPFRNKYLDLLRKEFPDRVRQAVRMVLAGICRTVQTFGPSHAHRAEAQS